MTDEGLTKRIKDFIEHHVFAVEQLDIMLLLLESPETEFTLEEVYDTILSSRPSVYSWLEGMVTHKMAQRTGMEPPAFKYAPQSTELRKLMEELAGIYRAFPVRVIEAIYHPARAIQNAPAQGLTWSRIPKP